MFKLTREQDATRVASRRLRRQTLTEEVMTVGHYWDNKTKEVERFVKQHGINIARDGVFFFATKNNKDVGAGFTYIAAAKSVAVFLELPQPK